VLPSRAAEVDTPVGLARVTVDDRGPDAPGTVVLGHGAGGGPQAPDLLAARSAALALGWSVALVEQPWRVRGARVAEAPPRLDAAWLVVCAWLRDAGHARLVTGGRSSGARVACRTAGEVGAVAVLALAFPLVPPRSRTQDSERTRLPELLAPAVPRLVVQGARDAFGVPTAAPGVRVRVVAGADHAFAVRRKDGRTSAEVLAEVETAVSGWLAAQTET
jgi:predicted alpha/beta-hydrolase family hydrolase